MYAFNKIKLTQFKNYVDASFQFDSHVVGICGANGVGKTNLIDAIHYCCMAKSYFHTSDQLSVAFEQQGFRLEAGIEQYGSHDQVVAVYRSQGKKELSVNGIEYDKLSNHIGRYPCVMVVPDDIEIINGGGEIRRKLIDVLLSQLDSNYLKSLIQYNKLLLQRNSFLKSLASSPSKDMSLLDVLDQQVLTPAQYIFDKRRSLSEDYLPLVLDRYHRISGDRENLEIHYRSKLFDEQFEKLLQINRQKDLMMQRTTEGIHRDDWLVNLDGHSFKTIASQGQKKSLLFAFKIAEHAILSEKKGFPPIMLLDDVFEKLDEQRMRQLLQYVCSRAQGQVFITDTHRERMEKALRLDGIKFQMISL